VSNLRMTLMELIRLAGVLFVCQLACLQWRLSWRFSCAGRRFTRRDWWPHQFLMDTGLNRCSRFRALSSLFQVHLTLLSGHRLTSDGTLIDIFDISCRIIPCR